MISILLISLACSLVYSRRLWIHNNLAEQMIKSKDIMILNLQQQIRMKDNKIYGLRRRIKWAMDRNRKILFRSNFKAWLDYYYPKIKYAEFTGATQFHCDALYKLLKDEVTIADLKKE